MTKLPAARPSPRVAGGVLRWYAGDTFSVTLALELKKAFQEKGYPFLVDSSTNQQFPILPDEHLAVLKKKYAYSDQQRMDASHSAVRFCTGWATKPEHVQQLIEDIRAL